jgi:hypothetical protein
MAVPVDEGIVVVTGTTDGGVFCVHPARKTAEMQTRMIIRIFLSIIKNHF